MDGPALDDVVAWCTICGRALHVGDRLCDHDADETATPDVIRELREHDLLRRSVVPSPAHDQPVTVQDDHLVTEPLTLAEVREIEEAALDFADANGNVLLAADDAAQLARQHLQQSAQLDTLVAAVTAVHKLHQDDGEGFCTACRTDAYPCATALAIGADQ